MPTYYPMHAYLPAYRSTYFWSPWMHDPFGKKPYNRYNHSHKYLNQFVPWAPQSTYRYPWKLPQFPLVGAQGSAAWGYPGYFPGVPTVTGFPSGGAAGFPHPSYPFLAPHGSLSGYYMRPEDWIPAGHAAQVGSSSSSSSSSGGSSSSTFSSVG